MPGFEAPQNENNMPVELWTDELHRICGNFQPGGLTGQRMTKGGVSLRKFHGVEVAHVRCDLPALMRTRKEISEEPQNHMFLILQTDGDCTIRQGRQDVRLVSNSFALVDSGIPVDMQFGPGMSQQYSFHLPREHFAKVSGLSGYTLGLAADDPRAQTITSFLRSMFMLDDPAGGSYERQHVLENLTMIAFSRQRPMIDPRMALYHRAIAEIETGFRDPELTPSKLAERIGEPLRSVQLVFQDHSETISEAINRQRINAFQADLEQYISSGRRPEIANLALNAGFNDVSYFNRRYRAAFGMSPRQFVTRRM